MDTEKVGYDPLAKFQKEIDETIPATARKMLELKYKNKLEVKSSEGDTLVESDLKPDNVLGRGDTALVLSGTYQGREVAIKIFTSTDPKMTEDELKVHMTNEVKALKGIDHPNIAKYYGNGEIKITEKKGLPVIIRELIPISLESKIQNQKLSLNEITSITKSMASALEYMYDTKQLVQTDITPENIRQRADGTWVIVDFGHLAQAGTENPVGIDDSFTAPEVIKNRDDIREQNNLATPASEVYSLGKLVWSCLTGIKINRQNYIVDLEFPITQENLPEPIFKVLQKAISTDPNERFSTPMEFSNALDLAAFGDYSI